MATRKCPECEADMRLVNGAYWCPKCNRVVDNRYTDEPGTSLAFDMRECGHCRRVTKWRLINGMYRCSVCGKA